MRRMTIAAEEEEKNNREIDTKVSTLWPQNYLVSGEEEETVDWQP